MGLPEMGRYCRKLILAIGIFVFCQPPVYADPDPDKSIAIEVTRNGNMLIVDATIVLSSTPREAWDVLTDYDHMVKFLHHLQFSKIVEGADNKIQVAQKGKATFGPLSFAFDSVREVELKPYQEIRSHVISGSIKQGDGTTRLIPEGNGTRIVYHNETMPNNWVPPGIGPVLVGKEIRAQFEDMKNEGYVTVK
jgi:hypothetical protein